MRGDGSWTRFVVVDAVKNDFILPSFQIEFKVLTDWLIAVIFEGRL